MKTKIKIFSVIIMLFIGACTLTQKASAQGGYVSIQVFYDELSPYGTWVFSPDYGYVWIPDAGPGFTPYYTNGYWIFTDQGWAWVSYYSWGWAPFHYGRWYIDPYYGPMWVPDYQWSPAWVTWRRSGDYYGWAPIGPGVSINIAYSNGYYIPDNHWTFVRTSDFGRRDINNYYVNSTNNVTIINNSTVINNIRVDKSNNVTYHAGPDRTEVEKHVGKTIAPVAIKASSTPGQNLNKNQLHIYKPQVQKNVSSGGQKPAPAKVTSLEDMKPASPRAGGTPSQNPNKQVNQQPSQQQQPDQPAKHQPSQQQQPDQQSKQRQTQQQQIDPPDKQQPANQPQDVQSAKQQQSKTQKATQPKNADKAKQPKQSKQNKNPDAEKPPH